MLVEGLPFLEKKGRASTSSARTEAEVVFSLVCHPSQRSITVLSVTVEVLGGHDDLLLRYCINDERAVIVPQSTSPRRTDDLWRTTCFELFLKAEVDERYFEFNFSPSTQWAAYSFERYREGRTDLVRDVDPSIERMTNGIEVDCDLGGLPNRNLRLGLCAVIEETDGTKSYWALAHAPGPPDFHNPACFTATLPPPPAP